MDKGLAALYTDFMQRVFEKLFRLCMGLFTSIGVLALGFVLYFILREALPLFAQVSVKDFLFGTRWMPIAYVGEPSYGIFHFILGTLYVSFLAMAFASAVGIGAALFLACMASEKARSWLYPCIDLLAGSLR